MKGQCKNGIGNKRVKRKLDKENERQCKTKQEETR